MYRHFIVICLYLLHISSDGNAETIKWSTWKQRSNWSVSDFDANNIKNYVYSEGYTKSDGNIDVDEECLLFIDQSLDLNDFQNVNCERLAENVEKLKNKSGKQCGVVKKVNKQIVAMGLIPCDAFLKTPIKSSAITMSNYSNIWKTIAIFVIVTLFV